ncbi:MAG: DUF2273 domain-containing protein [Candidatus Desulforudis sp.]|nr:DUF2273 domain-containing protein [Desulforudis sp.]
MAVDFNWQALLRYHWGKILGVILGLVFGWFAITYGLLKAIFVAVTIGISTTPAN